MSRKRILIALIMGAMASSAAAVSFVSPLSDAEATFAGNRVPAAEIASLVDEMAPGAVVTEQGDGSVALTGALNAQQQAELRRARELADANPWVIQCESAGATFKCVAVPDSDVSASVRAGEKGLYNRVIYRSISTEVTDKGAPMFDVDELVCRGFTATARTSCRRIDDVHPVIPRGETLFMTYRPLHMTFDEHGGPIIHVTRSPQVPLQRAAP